MLFSLLLTTLLSQVPVAQAPSPIVPFGEAVRAANEGREAEALEAFQRLAAANPNDHEVRLWIARLHERMGHPDRAEAVYRSVLLEDPINVAAIVGVANTVQARGEIEEAIELLERAEELAPNNDQVLASLGLVHRRAGRASRAIDYLERAVAVAPTAQHRQRLEQARLAYLHRAETRGFGEQYNGTTPSTASGQVTLNVRLTETLRVIGRGEVQRKFRFREERGGGGIEWRWTPATSLRALALVGPDNRVMPEGDFLFAVDHVTGRAVWTGSIRYVDFTGARVSVVSPAVTWAASDRLALGVRYAASVTESNTILGREVGHSLQVRGGYRVYSRLWATAGYARGVEDFDHFSIDRIGAFRADTASAGLRIDLATLTSIQGVYEHQWRERGLEMGRVTVSLAQRF